MYCLVLYWGGRSRIASAAARHCSIGDWCILPVSCIIMIYYHHGNNEGTRSLAQLPAS